MTADAQPRKRKDKRKNKKGDEEMVAPVPGGAVKGPPPSPTPPPQQGDSEVMHIYKESSIGGNAVTKVLFFVLMSGLVALVTVSIVQLREPPQIAEVDVSKGEAVEVSWSEWLLDPSAILSFGADDGFGEHEEEHDEHEEHEDEQEDHDGHDVDEPDDEHDEHGDHEDLDEHDDHDVSEGGWLTWPEWSWGAGEEAVEEHDQSAEEDDDLQGDEENDQEEGDEEDNMELEADEEELDNEINESKEEANDDEEDEDNQLEDDHMDASEPDLADFQSEEEEPEDLYPYNDAPLDQDDLEQRYVRKESDEEDEEEEEKFIPKKREERDQEIAVDEPPKIDINQNMINRKEDISMKQKLTEDEERQLFERMWEEMDETEDLFPEAKEALKMEKEQSSKKSEYTSDIVDHSDELMHDSVDEPEVEELETPEDAGEEEAEGMTLKLLVGVALVFVAHVVLVRKWNSMEQEAAATRETLPAKPTAPELKKEVKRESDPVKQEAPRVVHAPARSAAPVLPKPPPPSLTPPPSDDEEQLSETNYSDDEKIEEEEEIEDIEEISNPSEVEEEEEIEEVHGGSEGEEVEEESEEEEPPPPTPKQKPLASGRSRGGPQTIEDDDWALKEELDLLDEEFNRLVDPKMTDIDAVAICSKKYKAVIKKWPKSGRAAAAAATCLDTAAEKAQSNNLLDKAISAYLSALDLVWSDKAFLDTASKTIDRIRFRGKMWLAVDVHKKIIQRFPDEYSYRNDLAITFLMQNRLDEALDVFKEVMSKWPGEPFSTAHYGLALKLKGKLAESIPYLEKGIANDTVKDSRLYFHLGDAMMRIGKNPDEIYKRGAKLGLFKSKDQRSLYNVNRLISKPFWDPFATPYAAFFRKLQDQWTKIREEAKAAMKLNHQGFRNESENLTDKGDWKQFEMFSRGLENRVNCQVMPFTCKLVASERAARSCTRGQTKLSLMTGGTHVWPHCGPTNCRLRAHLGLIVPPGPAIRVANITKKWEEGKWLMFDDSFEHEVWHNGTLPRLVLIVDVWHPDITPEERRTLKPV